MSKGQSQTGVHHHNATLENGKTRSPFVTVEQADILRRQVDGLRKSRGHVDALWEACEEWADNPLGESSGSTGELTKGLQTNLQNEIVQEIEALLGHQAVADLDFEALEIAARRRGSTTGHPSAGTAAERRHH